MGKIIIRSSSFEEELERQHRMRLMNNLFRRTDAAFQRMDDQKMDDSFERLGTAFHEPIYVKKADTDTDKIVIQLRTAVDWVALAVFLLGEIAGGIYVTLNYGWLPVLCFLSAVFVTYIIIVFYNADNFNIKALIKCLIGISCTCLLIFLANKINKNMIEDDKSIRSAIAVATAIFGVASVMWSFIFCGIIYEINSRLRKQKQTKIEVEQREAEKEAKRRQEAERAKVEEARIKQEELKQQEYRNFCKEFVNNFWNEFFDSDEDTDVLLSRLSFTLENSGYRNWKTEFYDKVVAKVKATKRPPKSARSRQQSHTTDENLGGLKMYFNGVWLTTAQYRILNRYPQVKDLYGEDLLDFCRMLAEKIPEFANSYVGGEDSRICQL